MATIYVEYSDATKTAIQVVFAGPQDPAVWPNQGEVDSGDGIYKEWFAAQPVNVQPSLPQPTN
ncbi:hypothetical protein [Burkholderia ubonensis]|uniref:hypothetical protein n=1 Tax=Burkholderia ubonensis TaxID=101571 RepID=UPI0012FBC095|nr:hypothetical protein [Burkholderia ubonensis]